MVADLKLFGRTSAGEAVHAIDLRRGSLRATVLTFGARLHRFSQGAGPNLVVPAETVSDYEGTFQYFNPVIAPVVNRIAGGTARIGEREHRLEKNQDGRHSLHSGSAGTQCRVWSATQPDDHSVRLSAEMSDGEGGLPGNRTISVDFQLLTNTTLRIAISARTDALTLMNPALHGVWNLDGSPDWAGHRIELPADRVLEINDDIIPTGRVVDVAGTRFDYRTERPLLSGLDHCFCYPSAPGRLDMLARLTGSGGQEMTILSDAPGLQVYSGGKTGIALEPQLWPDAPHHAGFPSILLGPGAEFSQESHYVLGG